MYPSAKALELNEQMSKQKEQLCFATVGVSAWTTLETHEVFLLCNSKLEVQKILLKAETESRNTDTNT